MYNKEQKEGFCDSYLRSRVIAKTSLYGFFNKIESYEETLGKDVVEFSKEEALDMYRWIKSRSIYTLMNNNTILKSYYAWKKYYHGVENENAYEQITIKDLTPCIDQNASKLLSREEIIEIEDQLLNYTDAAIVQALFEGISGPSMRDITSLNSQMLDKYNCCLIFPDGRAYDISERLCDLLEKAFDEDVYICYGEELRTKQLIGKGKLFKERDNEYATDSDDVRFRKVYRKIRIIRDFVGIKELTMKGIASAGMLYYLKKCLAETGMELKEFLKTPDGEKLMDRYGFESEFRVDNLVHRYKNLV